MKIATFNLKNLFDAGCSFPYYGEEATYTPEFLSARLDWIAGIVRRMDADILFLQEIASEQILKQVADRAKPPYLVFMGTPDRRGIANAVLYRLPGCSCKAIPPEGPLPVFVEGDEDLYGKRIADVPRRAFVQLETVYRGRPLTLIGVHIKASFGIQAKDREGKYLHAETQLDAADGFIRSALVRLSQSRKLRAIADALFAEDGSNTQFVLLGDFNALEYSEVLRIIRGELGETPMSLYDACDLVPTRKRFSHIKDGRPRLIDHMMVSEGVLQSIRSVRILNRKLRDQTPGTIALTAIESDHAPIVMALK